MSQNQLQVNPNGMKIFQTDTGEVKLSPDIVRQYLVNGGGVVTDQEIMMYIKLCEAQSLNPFIKEAHLIKYGTKTPATMVVGKDVFMKRAAKHQDFDGLESGVIVAKDGSIEYKQGEFYLKDREELVGSWAKVHRKSWKLPISVEINFNEYVGKKSDGTVNSQWSGKPATMVVKVAETQALRKAFVETLQGMYDESEMNVSVEQDGVITIPEEEVVVREEQTPEEEAKIEAALEAEAMRQSVINDGNNKPF